MKKLVLLITLVFSINLSALENLGNDNVNTSMCYVWGYSWTHYVNNNPLAGINDPQANICFDIRNVGTTFWDDGSHGNATSTANDLEGDYLLVITSYSIHYTKLYETR